MSPKLSVPQVLDEWNNLFSVSLSKFYIRVCFRVNVDAVTSILKSRWIKNSMEVEYFSAEKAKADTMSVIRTYDSDERILKSGLGSGSALFCLLFFTKDPDPGVVETRSGFKSCLVSTNFSLLTYSLLTLLVKHLSQVMLLW